LNCSLRSFAAHARVTITSDRGTPRYQTAINPGLRVMIHVATCRASQRRGNRCPPAAHRETGPTPTRSHVTAAPHRRHRPGRLGHLRSPQSAKNPAAPNCEFVYGDFIGNDRGADFVEPLPATRPDSSREREPLDRHRPRITFHIREMVNGPPSSVNSGSRSAPATLRERTK